MARYFVNPDQDDDGDNEVHRDGCHRIPASPEYLGDFSGCFAAVAAAKSRYPRADGCAICSPECHTR